MGKHKRGNANNQETGSGSSTDNSPEGANPRKSVRVGPTQIGLTLPSDSDFSENMPSQAEFSQLQRSLNSMQQKLDEQAEELKNLRQENTAIKKELLDLKKQSQFSESNFHKFFMSSMIQWEKEKEEKQSKKPNFVIYGMPEGKNLDNDEDEDIPPEHQRDVDSALANKIIASTGIESASVINVFRMGKGKNRDGTPAKFPSLIKVETNSEEVKKAVLRKQKDILEGIPVMTAYKDKFSQYLRADMTFAERMQIAELVRQRNAKNEGIPHDQPKWKVYNFSLIPPGQGNLNRA